MKKMTKTAIKNFLKKDDGDSTEVTVELINGGKTLDVCIKKSITLLQYMDMMQYAIDTCKSESDNSIIQSCIDFAWKCAVVRAYTNINVDELDIEDLFALIERFDLYNVITENTANDVYYYEKTYKAIINREIDRETSVFASLFEMIEDVITRNEDKLKDIDPKFLMDGLQKIGNMDETKVAQIVMDMRNKDSDVNVDSK